MYRSGFGGERAFCMVKDSRDETEICDGEECIFQQILKKTGSKVAYRGGERIK